jgi:Cu/Ag efflux protein CusF
MVAIVATALFAGVTLDLRAADQPVEKPADGKKETPEKLKPFNGKVKSVDKAAKSITLEGEKAQTLQLNSGSCN